MKEKLIASSYAAAAMIVKGHQCRAVPKGNEADCIYLFPATKRLEADLVQHQEDIDFLEWIDAHRRLRWETRDLLRDLKRLKGAEVRDHA